MKPWKQVNCKQGVNGIVAVYAEPLAANLVDGGRYRVVVIDKRAYLRTIKSLYANQSAAMEAAEREAGRLGLGDAADTALGYVQPAAV